MIFSIATYIYAVVKAAVVANNMSVMLFAIHIFEYIHYVYAVAALIPLAAYKTIRSLN